ncbi:MAG: hypothetical protein U0166_26505 [Acidobacteriota bacterium]
MPSEAPARLPRTYALSSGRSCVLSFAPRRLARSYFVMTVPLAQGEPTAAEEDEMLALALSGARTVASSCAGDSESFTLIHSGRRTRRVRGWHVHIVVTRCRLEKAALYLALSGKNALQAIGIRA